MNRNLDGIYFRIKRGDKYESICFSDLTVEEREELCEGKSEAWLKTVVYHLADCLRGIGDELDLVGE